MNTAPALSVVVPTTQPWPTIRPCLERLRAQSRDDVELVVADGAPDGSPGLPAAERARVRYVARPDASVFSLRAAGLGTADGAIVAFTEDHCLPHLDWYDAMLEAHRMHPEADGIGGAVVNGSAARLSDVANFALTFAPFVPPLGVGLADRAPVVANASYKRRVLPPNEPAPGWLELLLNAELLARRRVVFVDEVLVEHVQSHGVLGTFAAHFHNGRTSAGLSGPNDRPNATRILTRLPSLLAGTAAATHAKRLPGRWASLPMVVGLVLCHGIGELVGRARGAGASPTRLR